MSAQKIGSRAGTHVLSLLSDPLNVGVITALANGPRSVGDLRRIVGLPSQTTLRGRLRALIADGAIARREEEGFPGVVTHELTQSGRELQALTEFLADWLAAAPDGPLQIGSPQARAAIKALAGGWTTNMLRALAVKPLSLTDLDRVITRMNYPALERRLDAMRMTGQVVSSTTNGAKPYSVTDWLREAVGPLIAAVGWERRAKIDTPGPHRHDVETLFLLAIPTLDVAGADGTCRLEVQIATKAASDAADILVTIDDGRVISCRASRENNVPNWASGTTSAWLSALSGDDAAAIKTGGDRRIPAALIAGLQRTVRSVGHFGHVSA